MFEKVSNLILYIRWKKNSSPRGKDIDYIKKCIYFFFST